MTETPLTSRQRIQAALRHQESDRIPFDLGATLMTGIHVDAYERLRAALGLPAVPCRLFNDDGQIAWVDDDLADLLGADAAPLLLGFPDAWQRVEETREDGVHYINEFGLGLKMPHGGYYFDAHEAPLRDVTSLAELDAYPFPDPYDPGRTRGLREKVVQAAASGRAVVLAASCAGAMQTAAWLCGFERFYSALAAEPDFAERLLARLTEFKLATWERALTEVGDHVDVVVESDDLGGQARALISPRMYRRAVKPHHQRLLRFIKERTNAALFFHSCGAVREFIPDLIEMGVDILNPVQVSAAGMDSAELKREFGRELVFWGGGVDTQRVLGRGTPAAVRAEVRRRIDDLAPGGGFVFAAVHNIQANVPAENILAMWRELRGMD